MYSIGWYKYEWKIRGIEPTVFPEPTRSILVFFSTPALRFKWDFNTSTYPVNTARLLGEPGQNYREVRLEYLRIHNAHNQFILNLNFKLPHAQSRVTHGSNIIQRNQKIYNRVIGDLIEAQAVLEENQLLTLIEFLTGGATSLAHDYIFEEIATRVKNELTRPLVKFKILQIPQEYRKIEPEELRIRINQIEDIIKRDIDSIKLIILYPALYSSKERKNIFDPTKTIELNQKINELILFLEEISSYENVDMYRQLTDLQRYGQIYVSTPVMSSNEFQKSVQRNEYTLFLDRDYGINFELGNSILLVHGNETSVRTCAVEFFEKKVGQDSIIAAHERRPRDVKCILLFRLDQDQAINILNEFKLWEKT